MFVVCSVKTTIELVGSCCTLITDMLLEAAFNIPEQVCEMLYSMYQLSHIYRLVIDYTWQVFTTFDPFIS